MNYYSNKNINGNYFLLPNQIFLLGLTAAEIAVYAYLIRCENRETFTCYPSFNTIGKATNLCKSTVSKCVKSLEEKDLIYTEQTSIITKSGKKKNGNLRYTIRPISEAVDSFNRRKLREMERELRKRLSVWHTEWRSLFHPGEPSEQHFSPWVRRSYGEPLPM